MKRLLAMALAGSVMAASSAWAALKPGDAAPDFSLDAAKGGQAFHYSLADALKSGPVVLYFYPKSFTKGCTIEAHLFADTIGDFAAAGASVIGLSADNIDIQKDFSSRECRDKLPVAADSDLKTIKAFDAVRAAPLASGETVSARISYVITPNGKILSALEDSSPEKHVENALAVVRQWHNTIGLKN